MDFEIQALKDIKGKVSALHGYAEILQNKFSKDIQACIAGTVTIFESQMGDVCRFVLTSQGEQIGDCKVVMDHAQKVFYVSSIAIVPNLQQNGISKKLYNTVIVPKFSKEYPGYVFAPGVEQTKLGKKLWDSSSK